MKIFAIQQGEYSSRKNPSQKELVHGEKKTHFYSSLFHYFLILAHCEYTTNFLVLCIVDRQLDARNCEINIISPTI